MTPGRLLLLIQRDLHRGPAACHAHYCIAPRILRRPFPLPERTVEDVEIHVLTSRYDWIDALWMLASFYRQSGLRVPAVLHDDGSLTPDHFRKIRGVFPAIRSIPRAEADAVIERELGGYPTVLAYRRTHPAALKLIDGPHFCQASRLILIDSDVLFFSPPREILTWLAGERPGCWFNRDMFSAYNLSPEEAATAFGVTLWPEVNVGLCLVEKQVRNLELCERFLSSPLAERSLSFWREQSCWALSASAYGVGGHLPPTYEISMNRHRRPGCVARHYVSKVRRFFYEEGIRELAPDLLQFLP